MRKASAGRTRKADRTRRRIALSVLLALFACTYAGSAGARAHARRQPDPCYAAFPSARSTTIGHSTFYNRQRSVQRVVCDGFGQSAKAHFEVTGGMACALISQAIPEKYHNAALFLDGSCSGAELAAHHGLETSVGLACGFTADLLGVPLPLAGKLAGLACAVAPSAGHFLGAWAESRHERAIARDVVRHGKCIRFNRHLVTRWSAVKCARQDLGFRNLPRPVTHKPKPPSQPQAPRWITLPGTVLSYTDSALLTADNSLGRGSDGTYQPSYTVIGTQSGPMVRIDGREGIPGGTTVGGENTLMTDPSRGHPLGLAVLTLLVTFPQNGISPPYTKGYFSVFDVASGQRLMTSAPFDPDLTNATLLAYINGDVRLASSDFVTVDPAGNVSHAPFPGNGDQSGTGSFVESPVENGLVLVDGYDQAPDACPTVYVVNVVSETTVSQTPCLDNLNNTNYSAYYFDGSVFAVPGTATFFSAAAGTALTMPGELGPDGQTGFTQGIRSDLSLEQNANGGYSYFVSTASWQPVFTATPQQDFAPAGIADDYAWVDTSHWEGVSYVGGRIVIDAHNGNQVANSWRVFPIAGGSGWTLTSTADVCCETQYLLRSSGTLLAALNSLPSS